MRRHRIASCNSSELDDLDHQWVLCCRGSGDGIGSRMPGQSCASACGIYGALPSNPDGCPSLHNPHRHGHSRAGPAPCLQIPAWVPRTGACWHGRCGPGSCTSEPKCHIPIHLICPWFSIECMIPSLSVRYCNWAFNDGSEAVRLSSDPACGAWETRGLSLPIHCCILAGCTQMVVGFCTSSEEGGSHSCK